MGDPELMREFIRDAFHDGALDLGAGPDRKYLEGFVRLFAGEMDALIAVQHATYLDDDVRARLLEIAGPSDDSVRHFKAWHDRAIGGQS